jgi:hypothetical protein
MMPTVPFFLFGDVAQMHALEAPSDLCVATKKTHTVSGVAIKGNKACQQKEVTYKFPKGMTCSNKHFSDKDFGKFKLSNLLVFSKQLSGRIARLVRTSSKKSSAVIGSW